MKSNHHTGDERTVPMIQFVTSMLIFGTIGLFRRYISLPSGFLTFSRGLLGALSLIIFVKLKGGRVFRHVGTRDLVWMIATGALMGGDWIMLFEAYNHTTIAAATLCYYMQPIIVLLLSPLFFKERLTAKKLVCACVAVTGMVLVSGVTESGAWQSAHMRGILLGLGAALLYAGFVIINKKISGVDACQRAVIQLLAAAGVMIPYLLLSNDLGKVSFDPLSVVLLFVVGIVHTGVAYVLYFRGVERLKAQTIALFSYIDPVSALLFSALLLHESLSAAGMAGAVMILGAAVASEIERKKRIQS